MHADVSPAPEHAAGAANRNRRAWGAAMAALGCAFCIFSALVLPWARVRVSWKSLLFGNDLDLGTYTFRLTENVWLTTVLVSAACLCLAGLLWRRRSGTIAVSVSILLTAGYAAYLVSLFRDALDFLGLYERLLELARALPLIGPAAEEAVRERLAVQALPHAGGFVFTVGVALILAGGLLLRRSAPRCGTAATDQNGHV